MKNNPILQNNSQFAGYHVVGKLSTNHDGDREVYFAKDSANKAVVIVVYNLKSSRYLCKNVSRKCVPDFIEEVKICSTLKNKCFPKILNRGIDKVGNRRFGWIAQQFVDGKSLANEMQQRGKLSLADSIEITKQLATALRELSEHCNGGGHYNIRPDNIIVNYDHNNLKGVYVVGMSIAGLSYHGNPPFKDSHLSNLYRAPETMKGIFKQSSDVYSIGMLMLTMLLGDKIFIQHSYACTLPNVELSNDENTKNHKWHEPTEWNKIVWDSSNEIISAAARIVLHRVTLVNSYNRIPTFAKLFMYLVMLENRSIRNTTVSEQNERMVSAGSIKKELPETIRSKRTNHFSTVSQSTSGKGLDEVAGMSDLKAMLRRNFVDIVKNSNEAREYGITPPNGILLYGAPGCGKTFVAEKAAQESGLKYKIINPSDFGSIYIHGSQGKIAETFKDAEKNAPMILIFDEFDAIAPKRDIDSNQANEVNEILTQLNNCASKGIFVVATTNRPDMIDSACLRAGRMDEKFYVGLPDLEARKEIFMIELRKRPCDSNIDLEVLCNATKNFTCGDISYIVNEAARRCFDEFIHNGDGITVPLTTEKLMEVVNNFIPSISPKDIRLYMDLRDKMQHRDKENKSRSRVGFSTCS